MSLLDLLLPHRCAVCRGVGASPCPSCAAGLPAVPRLPPPPGVDRCEAAVAYAGDGRLLVADLKFGGRRGGVGWVAGELVGRLGGERPDVVTWVPAAPSHRRRGVDQAEVLARAVAGLTRVPARRLLRRGAGPAQGDKDAVARRRGPPLAAVGPVPASVLVVDDVVTTGGSVAAAARELRRAGATRVVVAALARTPR